MARGGEDFCALLQIRHARLGSLRHSRLQAKRCACSSSKTNRTSPGSSTLPGSALLFIADHVGRIEDAIAAARTQSYALAVLDRRLPDGEDGIGMIAELRRLQPGLRVLVLTACDRVDERISPASNAGADDYMTKPFDVDELMPAFAPRCAGPPAKRLRRSSSERCASIPGAAKCPCRPRARPAHKRERRSSTRWRA